jgi:hypothetical protein
MAPSPAVAKARAVLGIHHRHHPNDTHGLIERRREFITEKLADYISRTLAAAPPLHADQYDRLALLLRPGAASTASQGGVDR